MFPPEVNAQVALRPNTPLPARTWGEGDQKFVLPPGERGRVKESGKKYALVLFDHAPRAVFARLEDLEECTYA